MAVWNVPGEIEKEIEIKSLSNDQLEFYHDQMHIFWKKIEEGRVFGWTFNETHFMHKSVVIEMLVRNIDHLFPINELDNLKFAKNIHELTKIVNYVGHKKRKEKQKI